jgi:hypothetical protein
VGIENERAELEQLQYEIERRLTQPIDASSASFKTPFLKQESGLARSRETLIRKRVSQARHLLPITVAQIGTHFNELFREFAERNHFNGKDAIHQDALRFVRWLTVRPVAALDGLNAEMVLQVAERETMHIACRTRQFYVRFHRFDWEIGNRTDSSNPPKKRRTYWCVFKVLRMQRSVRLWPIG